MNLLKNLILQAGLIALVMLIGALCWRIIRLKIEQEIIRRAALKNHHHH